MDAKWYYDDCGNTVGPTSSEDIAHRIRRSTSQPHFVWTEGMSEWADASTLPEFSGLSEEKKPGPAPKLAQRAGRELIEYFWISAYLFICFTALLFYKATVLRSEGVEVATLSLALVKALILGKFILVLEALRIGERRNGVGTMLGDILKKTVLFVVLLVILTVIEEVIVGYFHGKGSREVLSQMAGGTLPQALATSILMLLVLAPYFAFREVSKSMGEGELVKLMTKRGSRGGSGPGHAR